MLKGATMCSGIGAPETALPNIQWLWSAEVEKFPSAVLSSRHPGSKNLGDITAPDFIEMARRFGPLGILVAGTPCQAFSVAGNRRSLEDARGNLTLRFVEVVDAIKPDAVLWENVLGVLSTKDNAFGCFLAALVGADDAIVPERGWTNAGMVSGPRRNAAWRVLDAQYFGLAQRRKRVFVVACPRNGADPREILFECEGVPRHSPPRREAGERTAADASERAGIGGGGREVGHTLKAKSNSDHREDSETFVVSPIGLDEEENATVDFFGTLKARQEGGGFEGSVFVPNNSHCLNAGGMGRIDYETETLVAAFKASHFTRGKDGAPSDIAPPVSADADKGDQDTLVFQSKASASQSMNPGDISPSMDIGKSDGLSIVGAFGVRRLLPVECEKLQGFSPGWTALPGAADGTRYRALGNSMAVPVISWIGKRIMAALEKQ